MEYIPSCSVGTDIVSADWILVLFELAVIGGVGGIMPDHAFVCEDLVCCENVPLSSHKMRYFFPSSHLFCTCAGKPRSKSQTKTKRSSSPTQDLVSGRVLIDSYLREISSKSKLSVSLDGMGVCAFAYRRITFVIEVPITPHAGFMVYSSFDGACSKSKLAERIDAWNIWLSNIGRQSRVSYVKAGQKTVFTLKGNEGDMGKCDAFQKTLEYFVEMSLKLHNILHPHEAKAEKNVCLTRSVP